MDGKKDLKVLTVYEYFNYSVFVEENDKVEEKFCIDATPFYGAIVENTDNVDKMVETIRSVVRKKTLSDVVMAIVYQMVVSVEKYDKLKEMLNSLSEEEVILQIYKQSLYKEDTISVVAVLPLVFSDRVSIGKIRS